MRIHMAGVVHDDPSMVAPLRSWLVDLIRRSARPVRFAAVEWYPEVLDQYCEAWDEFMSLARRDWRCTDDSDVLAVADSIAYEATIAADVFGSERVLWLDPDRRYDHPGREVYSWHAWRLALRGEGRRCPTLVKLSLLARGAAAGAARKPDRDRLLADRISAAATDDPDAWGVAILGALHVSDCWPDTTRQLLSADHDCSEPCFFGFEPCLR